MFPVCGSNMYFRWFGWFWVSPRILDLICWEHEHNDRYNNRLNLAAISIGYKFDYHRIDLYNPGKLCSHFGITATKGNEAISIRLLLILTICDLFSRKKTQYK